MEKALNLIAIIIMAGGPVATSVILLRLVFRLQWAIEELNRQADWRAVTVSAGPGIISTHKPGRGPHFEVDLEKFQPKASDAGGDK